MNERESREIPRAGPGEPTGEYAREFLREMLESRARGKNENCPATANDDPKMAPDGPETAEDGPETPRGRPHTGDHTGETARGYRREKQE